MGLFDDVAGALGGQSGISADFSALAGHLSGGGLQSVLSAFEQGGLGEVAQSWISTGTNLPISQAQLQSVLGSDMVTKLASSFGIDPANLSAALPAIIDHLTPNGQIPAGGVGDMLTQATSSGSLGTLLEGFLSHRT